MTHDHDHHGHGHHHHHALTGGEGDRRVLWAVLVNVLLTVAQIIGGVMAGSLALVADAIHNLSDAVSLGIAFLARRIARRPADDAMTFGYGRAEIVAALVNYTTLIVIAVYLAYEAVWRLIEPTEVMGWIVVIIAAIALIIDLATVLLTWRLSRESINIRAAFLHNVADALGSVGVIIAGSLIILYDWTIADALITLAIAGYILWHVFSDIGGVIRILMLGTPPETSPEKVVAALNGIEGVCGVHHVHIWQFDERVRSVEAHIVLEPAAFARSASVKRAAKALMSSEFGILHSTFELETEADGCTDEMIVGHPPASVGTNSSPVSS